MSFTIEKVSIGYIMSFMIEKVSIGYIIKCMKCGLEVILHFDSKLVSNILTYHCILEDVRKGVLIFGPHGFLQGNDQGHALGLGLRVRVKG